jgi:hypothetical protein
MVSAFPVSPQHDSLGYSVDHIKIDTFLAWNPAGAKPPLGGGRFHSDVCLQFHNCLYSDKLENQDSGINLDFQNIFCHGQLRTTTGDRVGLRLIQILKQLK